MTINYPLTIGSVTLNQGYFEGPNGDKGGMSDLGSKQKAAVLEFPGGIVTAQLYGSFPKVITWTGKLWGANAINRSFELQKLADNGQLVNLTWAQWNFQGFVEDYKVTAEGPNEIAYEIIYRPLVNNSTVTGGNSAPNTDPFTVTVSNALPTATQQANSPASGGTLPSSVPSSVSNLVDSINQALQGSGGSVANIPAPTLQTLQGQISNVQNQLQPIISGSDLQAASAAADLSGTMGILGSAFTDTLNPIITTIQTVNPNLYQIAAQYYGDPTMYGTIADANGLIDPLPDTGGLPISLTIPAAPSPNEPVSTVMTDALAA